MTSIFTTSSLAVNGIEYQNLDFKEGEITFITGSSGGGKSTLLKLFNGTVSPSSGDVYYRGENINGLDTISLRRKVSLVGQELYLFNGTILGNFEKFYAYREQPAPDEQTIQFFLTLCCLDFSLNSNCSTMSGGEKQRVYLAIFLSFKPEVLLLDEPTSALDSQNSRDLFDNVFRYCKASGISVIVVSHDLSLAEKFSEALIQIEKSACKEVTGDARHNQA